MSAACFHRRCGLPKQLLIVGGLLVFALLSAGCVEKADWQAMQGRASTPAGDLYGEHTVGQSFVSGHAGLSRVEVLLVHYEGSDRPAVPLLLRLCRDLACREEIASTTLPPETLAHNAPVTLRCPPQADSAGHTYYLLASAPQAAEPARTTLWAHASDLYPEGTRLLDGEPQPGDLNFWVYYELDAAGIAQGILGYFPAGAIPLLGLLLLLLAPGYLLARLLPAERHEDGLALLGTTLSLSVAAVPALLLLVSPAGPLLTPATVLGGGTFLALLALGLFVWDVARGRWRGAWRGATPVALAMFGITAAAILQRAVHALDLAGPLWIDAVHHTLLARLIVERGAIPGDYLPYVQVAPATYHFGFQSLVATLHLLTGMPLPDALLLLGQALSALSGLPLYVLGRRWGGSRWGGLAAALVPAAITLMPPYYISWSRYTELAGLFILPVAAVLWEKWVKRRRWHGGLGIVTAVALAGLLLTHVRVAAFFAVLALLMLIWATLRRRYAPWAMAGPWLRTFLAALAVALLTLPWLWPSIQHLWLPAAREWPVGGDTLALYYIFFGKSERLVQALAAGGALALLWRRKEAALLLLWVGLLPLLANPGFVGLQPGGPLEQLRPGLRLGAVVDNTSLGIALYVPLALAAALGVGGITQAARRALRRVAAWQEATRKRTGRPAPDWARLLGITGRWCGAALFLALGLWGTYQLREVVNNRTAILAPADRAAIAWIAENTPPDALFLINSYEWMAHVYAGQDGGYWIGPLSGRRTWPPPSLYGLGRREYVVAVNEVCQAAMATSSAEELYRLLRQHGFTHVYIGRYGGTLTAEELLKWPAFHPIYHRDGVWIFALEP